MDQEFTETAFLCPAKKEMTYEMNYYISEEYNLNAGSDLSHIHMPGRFIFGKLMDVIDVIAVAELPGETYLSPDHDIERLYLDRRRRYSNGIRVYSYMLL